jgi:hypothetical protein
MKIIIEWSNGEKLKLRNCSGDMKVWAENILIQKDESIPICKRGKWNTFYINPDHIRSITLEE